MQLNRLKYVVYNNYIKKNNFIGQENLKISNFMNLLIYLIRERKRERENIMFQTLF